MKIYIVYNQWQMDSETRHIILDKAFTTKEKAEARKTKLEKESEDAFDNYMIEEVECE